MKLYDKHFSSMDVNRVRIKQEKNDKIEMRQKL